MKAIMMSIRPEWVAKILNGDKTIEIRKKFPKGYVGWVYIYVTQGKPYIKECDHFRYVGDYEIANKGYYLNGKVVARFWCDKVEEHKPFFHWCIEKETCLTCDDVLDYLDSKDKSVGNPKRQDKVYAIHITKLDIFDKPKEIKEFHKPSWAKVRYKTMREEEAKQYLLTRAPQSFMFIEV